ncbi:MAG: nicotinate-nucleotide adenylyltransferase [Candidatus Omnitrophica bacterium]|nr:nicotinate-nucleotide adenylyltransferase [Candidatus Omnitrophota bacterium]
MIIRIGILGGTFDPVHNGHLYMACEVLKRLRLDKVILMPAYHPPHKKNTGITSARHRYNMLKLAVKGSKEFKVSDIEIKRKGRSYSIRTLKQLRERYGAEAKLFFIAGSDALKDIDTWRDLKGILGLCSFVIVKRPGSRIKMSRREFMILRIGAKDISATDIRKKIRCSGQVKKLIPSTVKDYIKSHGLYHIAKNI